MSVMSCARRGCKNVMCDRLSSEYGYICNECFDELVNLGPETDIELFMDQEKGEIFLKEDAYEKFDKIFSIREP